MRSICKHIDILICLFIYIICFFFLVPISSNFPLNDDWVYSLDVKNWLTEGRLHLTGLEYAWSLPQLTVATAFSKLFGFSFLLLRTVNLIFGGLLIIIIWQFLKSNIKSINMRLILLLSIIFYPPLFVLFPTFMSNIVFLCFWFLSLLLWQKAYNCNAIWLVYIGGLTTLIASLQRQYGLILPIITIASFYFTNLWENKRLSEDNNSALTKTLQIKKHFKFVSFGIIFIYLILQSHWASMGGSTGPKLFPNPNPLRIINDTHSVFVYGGWLFFPLIGFTRLEIKHKWQKLFFALLMVGTLIKFFVGKSFPYYANVVSIWGQFQNNEVLAGIRDPFMPKWIFDLLSVLFAYIAFFILNRLFNYLVDQYKQKSFWISGLKINFSKSIPFANLLIATASLAYLSFIVIRYWQFDRYLLDSLLLFVVIAMSSFKLNEETSEPKVKPLKSGIRLDRNFAFCLGYLICACTLYYDLALTYNYFSWNQVKWDIADSLIANNTVTPTELDAGYEWEGWNLHSNRNPDKVFEKKWVISFSILDGFKVLSEKQIDSLWPFAGTKIFLLEKIKQNP